MVPAAGPWLSDADQRGPSILYRRECPVGGKNTAKASADNAPLGRNRVAIILRLFAAEFAVAVCQRRRIQPRRGARGTAYSDSDNWPITEFRQEREGRAGRRRLCATKEELGRRFQDRIRLTCASGLVRSPRFPRCCALRPPSPAHRGWLRRTRPLSAT